MDDRKMPQQMRRSLRTYFHESQKVRRRNEEGLITQQMSPKLQGEVLSWMYKSHLENIPYLKNLEPDVVVSLALHLETLSFAPQEQIMLIRTLCMVQRGIAARSGRVLTPGNHWGSDMILNDKMLVDRSWARSLAHLEVLTLNRHGLDQCTEKFPAFATRIRWTVVRMTFMRKVIQMSEVFRKMSEFPYLDDESRINLIVQVFQSTLKPSKAISSDETVVEEVPEPTMTQLGTAMADLGRTMGEQSKQLAAIMQEVKVLRTERQQRQQRQRQLEQSALQPS
eukprot:gnl/TRDRNA2_/TRDRNA2_172056_c1_seq1.p1 gnl/TRDRNA2_/TRDRNA2_172056_c1~~gnl/TRDRNA2_/TRDRNA2_172056_c1_seq1.p1  ORF type:complete len:281 (-),score=45.35 gnl/TRDRNA2_/TRDRNA2_172056_c1_seq1:326-1168(-)